MKRAAFYFSARVYFSVSLLLTLGVGVATARAVEPDPADEPRSSIGASKPQSRADRLKSADYTELWRAGEYEAALDQLEGLLGTMRRGYPPRYLRDRAELYFELGRVDEAIADMETLVMQVPTPDYRLRLALMHRYRGQMEEYEEELAQAAALVQQPWSYGGYGENMVAWGRILELSGENPKAILNTLYATLIKNSPRFSEVHLAAGDLAQRYYDYELAADHYREALEIDEGNLEALAGLAECYWKSNDPRLAATLKEIREINPSHPRLRRIETEKLLDVGKVDEALKIIDAALAINPVHEDFLGLKSAAHFLKDETAAMKQAQAKALAFNPRNSVVFKTTGRIASRHYRFKEAAEFQKRALEANPEDHEARALYGLDLLRLAREEEGRAELEAAFAADPYNVHVYNMLQLLETLAGFERVEQGPFVLRMPEDEAPILSGDALALLEEAHARLEEKYAVDLAEPVHVQIFDHHDDFMVRSVGLPGSIGYMGICFGNLVTMDSPSARPKWEVNWRSVLWHEFAHVVTLHKTNNRMPRWLSEGISVYEETLRDPAWGQKLDAQYKALTKGEELPGLSSMEAWFTNAKTATHLMFGYFAAGEFVRHYVERYQFRALNDALTMIGQGVETEEALAKAAGVTVEEIDERFRADLAQRLEPLENLPEIALAESEPTTAVLDEGDTVTLEQQDWGAGRGEFVEAMRRAKEAQADEDWTAAELELKRAHQLFPDYQGADSPLRQLIALYETQGEREKLRETLERQVAESPTDFQAWRRLAHLRVEDEDWPGVLAASHGALGIDPFDSEMRGLLFVGQNATGRLEEALVTLDQLALLDPAHRRDYLHRKIEVMKAEGELERAREATLALLEETPHDWRAQQMLLAIVEESTAIGDVDDAPASS